MSEPDRQPPTIPGYTLTSRLGAGGYGEVWLANAPGGLTKAVKIIYGAFDDRRAELELRSLHRIKSVRHPFLLSLERIEVVDNRLAIVTELADSSLKDRYDECRRAGLPGVPRAELLGFLRDAADALDFLSERHSLQHLDVKPENLLIVGGHIKVADFGLVKEVGCTLHFRGARPGIDGSASAGDLGDGVDDLVAKVRAAWTGPTGPKLRLLPTHVGLDEVREQAGAPADRLLLGVDEKDLAPVAVDPDLEPHLLVLGDSGAGKSGVLRLLTQEIIRTRTPEQAQILLVDYRRALLGEVPEEYLLNYVTSAAQATPALAEIADYLQGRIPGPDVTPEQLRERSWWTGAELFVLVDDYDLVATQQSSPVAALQPLLAQARDVGLHLTVARRAGGASRALYEPVMQTLRDLAMPGLMLAGSPDEGPLLGNLRPVPGPPGRGRLVTRDRGVEVVQVAWADSAV